QEAGAKRTVCDRDEELQRKVTDLPDPKGGTPKSSSSLFSSLWRGLCMGRANTQVRPYDLYFIKTACGRELYFNKDGLCLRGCSKKTAGACGRRAD
ncbi:MAG: hypothetical protein LBI58_02375, partial [Tannerellaceae bacterium]|nr:hypothetical protein [Tannerellaceae bacterium]